MQLTLYIHASVVLFITNLILGGKKELQAQLKKMLKMPTSSADNTTPEKQRKKRETAAQKKLQNKPKKH